MTYESPLLTRRVAQPEINLLLAVPKKGRLYDRVMKIVHGAGLEHTREARLDVARCVRLPVTLVFLPAADIATYVSMGNVDLGITGQDVIAECDAEDSVDVLESLGIGHCKLCFQVPTNSPISKPEQLVGMRIATSFKHLVTKYFEPLDPQHTTTIRFVQGSVEVGPALGLADAVVDLVESGSTMHAAGLHSIGVLMETEMVLIANKHSQHADLIRRIHARIKGYILATRNSMISYNCPRPKIADAIKITPGHESPTIVPLDGGKLVSITALIQTKSAPEIMDQLKELGAQSIILYEIANCRF